MKRLLILFVSALLLIIVGCNLGDFQGNNDSSNSKASNPYAYIGEYHSAGLDYILNEFKSYSGNDISEVYMDIVKSSTIDFLKTTEFSNEAETVFDDGLFNTITQLLNSSSRADDNSLQYILDNYILSEEDIAFITGLMVAVDKFGEGDLVYFDEKTTEMVDEILASQNGSEEHAEVLTAIAVAIDSRDYWSIEQNKVDWFNTFVELTCLELGIDPSTVDPGDFVDIFLDCASLRNIVGADAGGAFIGALGGPGGAVGSGAATSGGLIVGCAAMAAYDWLVN